MRVIGLTTSTADRKRRAGQRIVVGLTGTAVSDEDRAFIRDARPGGFVLFSRNVEDPRQVRELNRELQALLPADLPPIRCVDQEGGRVQRIRAGATLWPPMRQLGNVADLPTTRAVAAALAREVRAMGFDLDFAPVADVDSNPKNPVIGDRAFGRNPQDVARHVAAFVESMQAAGCIACAKHFPGHGDTSVDSHLDLPIVEKDPPDLDQTEMPPFRAALAARVGAVMTAHVVFPAWDEDRPATMSSRIIRGQLRDRLGYDGVVFSDDMEMKAVRGRYPLDLQLREASAASVDVFLMCKDLSLAHEAWEHLVHLQEEDKRQEDAAIEANTRWHELRKRFFIDADPQPDLSVLGCQEHIDLALRVRARGGES